MARRALVLFLPMVFLGLGKFPAIATANETAVAWAPREIKLEAEGPHAWWSMIGIRCLTANLVSGWGFAFMVGDGEH